MAFGVVGLVGGLMLGFSVLQTKPQSHGGARVLLHSGFFWAGLAIVLITGLANGVNFLRSKRRSE